MKKRGECEVRPCPVCRAQCVLCWRQLHNGEHLVPYDPPGRETGFAHQVHASCAQELRGEAEG